MIKREDIPRAVVLALAGRLTSRPSCFGRNAPATAALSPISFSGYASSNVPHRSTSLPRTKVALELPLSLSLSSSPSIELWKLQSRQVTQLYSLSISLLIRLPCYPCVPSQNFFFLLPWSHHHSVEPTQVSIHLRSTRTMRFFFLFSSR